MRSIDDVNNDIDAERQKLAAIKMDLARAVTGKRQLEAEIHAPDVTRVGRTMNKRHIAMIGKEISGLCYRIAAIKSRLTELYCERAEVGRHGSEVFASDHAVMRWLERVHGLDIETLRLAAAKWAREHGHSTIVLSDDSNVITILPQPDGKPGQRLYRKRGGAA